MKAESLVSKVVWVKSERGCHQGIVKKEEG